MIATATGMILDPTQRSSPAQQLESALRARIVGQEEAIRAIVSVYQVFLAGLDLPSRPVGSLLFLGPTGSGKTRIVEATAEALFGDLRALIQVDCGEFQHSHEIAKLIGSPPGYLGHRETHPVLTQEALNQWHREDLRLSLILFDEIEKASDSLWQLLLGILDKATLTLGDNRRVDFSQTLIFMTSNLGAAEIANKLHGRIGFGMEMTAPDEKLEQKLKRIAIEAARRKFSPEFMNRIDKIIAFRPLTPPDLEQVLDIELERVRQRLLQARGGNQFEFLCSPEARWFLLQNGLDLRYGARHLRRSIERHLVDPLAHLLATHQVQSGDLLLADRSAEKNHLTFIKNECGGKLASWIAKKKNSLSFSKQNHSPHDKFGPHPQSHISSR
ncbi:MAG: ATP-dependent Clp protease ATP-binding subunit [Acidobacteria bacterium]|nr:ATP-dependent Clp protease ATP-binding subunit [Acidobacteriota bacterium]